MNKEDKKLTVIVSLAETAKELVKVANHHQTQ
jgi:hypothetical protein